MKKYRTPCSTRGTRRSAPSRWARPSAPSTCALRCESVSIFKVPKCHKTYRNPAAGFNIEPRSDTPPMFVNPVPDLNRQPECQIVITCTNDRLALINQFNYRNPTVTLYSNGGTSTCSTPALPMTTDLRNPEIVRYKRSKKS